MTDETGKATARPWKSEKPSKIWQINSKNRRPIALIVEHVGEETLANANLIVVAVNSHDAARELVEAVLSHCDDGTDRNLMELARAWRKAAGEDDFPEGAAGWGSEQGQGREDSND